MVHPRDNNMSLNIRNASSGRTALMKASLKGCVKTVDQLLKDGANPNVQDFREKTALIFASSEGHDKVVSRLLQDPRLDVNLSDAYGRTALMYASFYGYTKIVHRLLEVKGINVHQKDVDGKTASELAEKKRIKTNLEIFASTKVRKGVHNSAGLRNAVTWENIHGPKYYLLPNLLPNKKVRTVYSAKTIMKLANSGISPITRLPFKFPDEVGRFRMDGSSSGTKRKRNSTTKTD